MLKQFIVSGKELCPRGEWKLKPAKSCWNFSTSRQANNGKFLANCRIMACLPSPFSSAFFGGRKSWHFLRCFVENFCFQRKWFMRVFIVSSSPPPTPRLSILNAPKQVSEWSNKQASKQSSVWLIKLIPSLKRFRMFRSDLSKHLRHWRENSGVAIECVNNDRHCRSTLNRERDEIWSDAGIAV